MTKMFALPDTLSSPYFTIDAAATAVTVKSGTMEDGRMVVEIWRDDTVLCRVFAKTVEIDNTHKPVLPGEMTMQVNEQNEDYKLGYRHGSDSELPNGTYTYDYKAYIEGYAQGSIDRDERCASGKGHIHRPAWMTDAQVEAIRNLYRRSSDGARDCYEFFTRVKEHGSGSDRYAGLHWCNMFIGIERDGEAHT